MEQKYMIALEIGSSKIRGAVGTLDSSGILSVNAVEEEPLVDCVRYGCIQNVIEVTNRIRAIISRLEARIPGHRVVGAYVALGGKSLMATRAEIERQLPTVREITQELIDQIKEEAYGTAYNDRDVVSVTSREFKVDRSVVARPVGSFGRSVQATLNLITCRSLLKRNLNHVFSERLHLKVNGYIVRQLAEADLVLSNDEIRLGCMLVDFGSETTTVSIYKNGFLQYLATLPLGSRNITRDITTLNHLEEHAEQLKIAGGNANPDHSAADNRFIPDSTDYTEINNYVVARAGEIIANINEQLKYAGFTARDLPAGIIVIGNGAKLRGFNSRLESFTKMKVRAGMPVNMVRIADPRIRPSEVVDVISILQAAALAPDVKGCTEPIAPPVRPEEEKKPVIVPPDLDEDDEIEDEFGADEEEEDDYDRPRKNGGRKGPGFPTRFINKLRDKWNDIIDENDEEDDDIYDKR